MFLFSVNLAVVGRALTNRSDFREVHLTLFVFVLFLAYVFFFTAILRAQSEMILLEKDIAAELDNADRESHDLNYFKKCRFRHFKTYTWPIYWIGNGLVMVFLLSV